MESVYFDPSNMDRALEFLMSPPRPTSGVVVQRVSAGLMLHIAPALLVLSGGRPLSVLTRTDLLTYFEVVANG
jgi:cystathionine beta-synthase